MAGALSASTIPAPVADALPWLALVCGVAATVTGAWLVFDVWRTWRRVRDTREAALALVDVHRSRLDRAVVDVSGSMAGAAERSAAVFAALGTLRRDVDTLRWMVGRVPWERERLRSELVHLVLPTRGDDDEVGDDSRRARPSYDADFDHRRSSEDDDSWGDER